MSAEKGCLEYVKKRISTTCQGGLEEDTRFAHIFFDNSANVSRIFRCRMGVKLKDGRGKGIAVLTSGGDSQVKYQNMIDIYCQIATMINSLGNERGCQGRSEGRHLYGLSHLFHQRRIPGEKDKCLDTW